MPQHSHAGPHFHTIKQVAKRLQVNERTVRRWIAAGLLEAAHKFGGVVRISEDDLRAFLAINRGA
jgi:excisionase family DNA binding protein